MKLYVARRPTRTGLYLPMQGTKDKPSLLFFLPKCSPGQLDELVRKQLAEQNITNEAEVQSIVSQAEIESEYLIKVKETIKELKRLMALKAAGATLMQNGYRKWKQVIYPATKRLEK